MKKEERIKNWKIGKLKIEKNGLKNTNLTNLTNFMNFKNFMNLFLPLLFHSFLINK
jgi:hypothetical protein